MTARTQCGLIIVLAVKSYVIAFAAMGVLLSPVILVCARMLLFRRDVLRIMSENVSDEPTFTAVTQALAAINAASRTYFFNVQRTANILFRGHQVTLVAGPVGRVDAGRYGPTYLGDTCLYALADDQQVEWMKANPDVFSAACLASRYSVFGVNLKALKANQPVDVTGASRSSQSEIRTAAGFRR